MWHSFNFHSIFALWWVWFLQYGNFSRSPSFCYSDGQLQQSNVQIAGFSCIPTSIFRYQCNLCQCNFFGTSAHCVPAECPLVPVEKQKPVVETTEIPRPDTNSLKIPEPLCRPGEKEKQKVFENIFI